MSVNTFVYFFGNSPFLDLWQHRPLLVVMTVYDGTLVIVLASLSKRAALKVAAIVVASVALIFRLVGQFGLLDFLY